jgi:hypothetical protein
MKTLLKMMKVHETYKQSVWEDKEMTVEHQPIHEIKINAAQFEFKFFKVHGSEKNIYLLKHSK